MYVERRLKQDVEPIALGRHGIQKAVSLIYWDAPLREGRPRYGYLTIDNTRGASKSFWLQLEHDDLVAFARRIIEEDERVQDSA